MNVIFINEFSFSYLGGVELHILNLGKELLKQGARVTLVCRVQRQTGEWEPLAEGFRIVHAPKLRDLYAFLRSEGQYIDVCHAHMSRKPYALCGLLFSRLLGIPTVFTPHCFYPSEELSLRLAKRAYDETFSRLAFWLSSRVINLTPRDQQDSVERGMQIAKSRIIPNSICVPYLRNAQLLAFREKYGIQGDFLLHVGRFQKHKCIDFLVRNQPSIEKLGLVLIGQDDGELETVQRLVHTLGLSDRVYMLQKIPFEEICTAYREARCLVMASRNEGLPTVILEAAVFGTPTIAPKVGGIPYIIEGERIGYLYEWGDSEGYISCVQRMLDGPTRIDEVTRDELLSRFSWEANAIKVARVYQEVVHA
jgi:glycosyltransferase involved in cell wall biosynthesis